ncbi:MAG: hypothetical protein RLZZ53_1871 [Acidobacteriota bacterium]|jgi:putative ABC transport system permease protein
MGLRHALGRLVASPLFTIFSVVSLAAGVAVTTAVYSVIDTLLLPNMGVPNPDRVALILTPYGGRVDLGSVSDSDFAEFKAAQTSFAQVSATAAILPSVSSTGNAERLMVEAVDGAYFSTLGLRAAMGRLIVPADSDAGARVAVISDDYWHTRLAADPKVIGRTIRINGQSVEVIGVAAPDFQGLFGMMRTTRLWIPLGSEAVLNPRAPAPGRGNKLLVFGSVADARTIAAAAVEVTTISKRLDLERPRRDTAAAAAITARNWSAKSVDEFADEDDSLRRFGLTLVALVALVPAVACTNLANLVLARSSARQAELAVRMAMGASRGRLIWEQCIESLVIATLGAAASYVMFQLLTVWMTMDFVIGVPFGGTATLSIRPVANVEALSVAFVSMLLALAVFGLEPAITTARALDIRGALAAGANGVRPKIRRQQMVIRWQVAIAAGFFIVATMFIRSTLSQSRHDPGIEMDRLAVAVMSFDDDKWDQARITRAIERVTEESRRHQAIDTIAVSAGLPFGVPAPQVTTAIPEAPERTSRTPISAVAATPSIFRTLGVNIVRGRGFTDSDTSATERVTVISELAARQMFGPTDPIGRTLVITNPQHGVTNAVVVGIAADTDVRWIYRDRRPLVYLPLAQDRRPPVLSSGSV